MSGRDGGTGEGRAGCMCETCRAGDDQWCCESCHSLAKQMSPATSDADPASTSASEVEGLAEDEREQVALACDAMFDFGDTWIRFLREGNETVLLPVVERIVADREAAAETRGRAEAGERIAQAIERVPFALAVSEAAAIARADSLAAPRGDGETTS